MNRKFTWDEEKNAKNQEKHGVTFEAANEALDDYFCFTNFDYTSSVSENRHWSIGMTSDGQLLFVSHSDDRIISARRTLKRERKRYENEKKQR